MEEWTVDETCLDSEQQLAELKAAVSVSLEKIVTAYIKDANRAKKAIWQKYAESYSTAAAQQVEELVERRAAEEKRRREEATNPKDFESAIAGAIEDAGRWWDMNELAFIRAWIERRISPASMATINAEMVRRHVGKIETSDIAAIAYIHRDSILKQSGYSNHKRFIFNSGTERKLVAVKLYDDHLTVILKVLEQIGFSKKIAEKDRFNVNPQKRSVRYKMTADITFPR